MTDILSTCSNHKKGTLLIISSYVLGIIWGRNCFYLFDSHSKDGEGNISQNGTAVLLKFDTFSNLEECIKQIYYNGQNNETLYFQIQFINAVCTHEIKEHIKGKPKSSRNLLCQKMKRERLAKHFNQEKNVKKRKLKFYMMVGLKVSKIKFAKNVNREIWEIQRKEIPNSSTQKKRKHKFYLMIGSNVLKNKFGRDHIIYAQFVTKISLGVLSVIFQLKVIIILK